jgi:hypothetical protein
MSSLRHICAGILAADELREAAMSKPVIAVEEATADSPRQPAPEPTAVDPEMKTPDTEIEPDSRAPDTAPTVRPESAAAVHEAALVAATGPTIVPEAQTAVPEPLMIELVNDPPQEEFGDGAAEEEAA